MGRRVWAVVAAVPIVVGLAGCGGGGATGAAASPTGSAAAEDAKLEFARCMRENGVDVPDPGSGEQGTRVLGKGAGGEKLEKALDACRSLLQAGGMLPDLKDPEVRDRYVEFARCMRENGVDVPDPAPDGTVRLPEGDIDPGRLDRARAACEKALPGAGR
ncbi:hypothetical protein AB0L25_23515 [Spirillospora sp. NPDC052242]